MATPGNRDLTSAYADLVAGVLDARSDAATQAFDAEIAIAESEGRLDARTARALRWWQRESLRALVEHSRTALPPALAALGQAQADAARGAVDAAESWARAVGDSVEAEPRRALHGRAQLSTTTPSAAAPAGRADHVGHRPAGPQRSEDPRTAPDQPLAPPPDLRERRRRLIVAGLSPLPRED